MAAASQIFYSTGIGWGTLPAFASYNRHDHNFVRDAWLVPVINCGTSFLAGLAAFSVPRTHAPPPSPSPPSAAHQAWSSSPCSATCRKRPASCPRDADPKREAVTRNQQQ